MSIFGRGSDPKPESAAAPRPQPSPAPPPAQAGRCVIGSKTLLKGDVSGDEDVVVEGRVEGHVRIAQDLTIASGGRVKAQVKARRVVVSGELDGDCVAEERVEITSTGRLLGNIKAPKVVIAEGAVFRGNSDMSGGRTGT